jgi:hypothetical protein
VGGDGVRKNEDGTVTVSSHYFSRSSSALFSLLSITFITFITFYLNSPHSINVFGNFGPSVTFSRPEKPRKGHETFRNDKER